MKKKLILIISVIVIAVLAITGVKAAQGKLLMGSSAENSKKSQTADASQAKNDAQKTDENKGNDSKDEKKPEDKKAEAPKTQETNNSTASAKPQGTSTSSSGAAASKPQVNSNNGSEKPKPQTVSISIVDTVNGKSFPSGTVEIGSSSTVRDASVKFFSAKGINARFKGEGYIASINGLKEFDAGPSSGWCVYVNGKKIPVGIAEYAVKPGDAIVWKFMEDGVSN